MFSCSSINVQEHSTLLRLRNETHNAECDIMNIVKGEIIDGYVLKSNILN